MHDQACLALRTLCCSESVSAWVSPACGCTVVNLSRLGPQLAPEGVCPASRCAAANWIRIRPEVLCNQSRQVALSQHLWHVACNIWVDALGTVLPAARLPPLLHCSLATL